MKTFEMVSIADKNDNTYRAGDMLYNSRNGFHDTKGKAWPLAAYEEYINPFSSFIHEDDWEICKTEYSMEELYDIIGHRFSIKQK